MSRKQAQRRAKIVATVGPSSSTRTGISRLLGAGVNIVRLNLSHGTREEHRALVRRVRSVAQAEGRFVAVMIDLMGPRYRLGSIEGLVKLRKGQLVTMGSGKKVDLPLDDTSIVRHVEVGERVLIDNGLIGSVVTAKARGQFTVRIKSAGSVSSRKGINLPDSQLPFSVSEKDRADIAMAVEEDADFIAASYVGSARDVKTIARAIAKAGGAIPIVAKLERGWAIDNLEAIVEAADAVMVARGDLGVEVPLHLVPILQKRIVEMGWRKGKPVIVATQMIESMMENPRPTRAETSDIANAVFDGADALMLSGETAAGKYPVEAVQTMDRVIRTAEAHSLEVDRARFDNGNRVGEGRGTKPAFDVEPPVLPGTLEIPETISAAAVLASRQLGARYIVALTQGGFTVRMLAARRPSTPVVALTQNRQTARRLQMVWGVIPVFMEGEVRHHDEVVGLVDEHLHAARLVKAGDCIAILMGDPIQGRPPTNLLRLHRVRPRKNPGKKEGRSRGSRPVKKAAVKKRSAKKASGKRTAHKE